MRPLRFLLLLTPFLVPSAQATTLLNEGFDDVSLLSGAGWAIVNNSNPLGSTDWFQGQDLVFPAQTGAANSYVAANFQSAGLPGNISSWLLTPVLSLSDGDALAFYTRQSNGGVPDRMEVRLSTNGGSSDVGTTDASVGDFTTLLLSINPSLESPGYPTDWTLYTATLSGLPGTTAGRIGFRYSVTNTSLNADYIGIDTLTYSAVPEPSTATLLVFAGAALPLLRRNRRRL